MQNQQETDREECEYTNDQEYMVDQDIDLDCAIRTLEEWKQILSVDSSGIFSDPKGKCEHLCLFS
jgi:hypothetical protein